MDHKLLFGYIQEAVKVAAGNLENCKAGCQRLTVPGVRVIGKTRIESLSQLVDKALQRAKQTVVPIFGCEGLGLVILLALM
jgi:predicted neutral ceramidase superfamily lipid hydrolase